MIGKVLEKAVYFAFLRSLEYLMSFRKSATNTSCVFGLNRTLYADLTIDPTKYAETWYIWRTVKS